MKYLLIFTLFLNVNLIGQTVQKSCDQIIFINGDIIKIKVLNITPEKIFFSNCDSEIKGEANVENVFLIKFSDGTKKIFHDLNTYNIQETKSPKIESSELNTLNKKSLKDLSISDNSLEIVKKDGNKYSCKIINIYSNNIKCYNIKTNKKIIFWISDIESVRDWENKIIYKD